jgi:diguanylate cyclase (GGDEF)-like protein
MDTFLYLLPYGISLVLTLIAGWYVWRMRTRTGAPLFLAVIFGQALWIIGAMIGGTAPGSPFAPFLSALSLASYALLVVVSLFLIFRVFRAPSFSLDQGLVIIVGYAILVAAGLLMTQVLPPAKRSIPPLTFGLCNILFAWGLFGFHQDLEKLVEEQTRAVYTTNAELEAEIARGRQAEVSLRQSQELLEKRVEERTQQLREANQLLSNEKARLQSYHRQREYLREMTALLQASISTDEAGRIVASYIGMLFPAWNGALYFITSAASVEPVTVWGKDSIRLDHLFSTNNCWALRQGKTYLVGRDIPHPVCQHVKAGGFDHLTASLCIPLSGQGVNIGILHMVLPESSDCLEMQKEELAMLENIAESVALSLANLSLRECLHEQSIRDSLSGLYNHRYLTDTLAREVLHSRRLHIPLSVIMLEIDNFRSYNNTYGHEAGNYVVKKLGENLVANLRSSDIPCRYGGDEFTLILPGMPLDDAAQMAEQIRQAILSMDLRYNSQPLGKVTVSVGVAEFPMHGETGEMVLKAADAASYRAKAMGKNCVVVAEARAHS